MKVTKDKIEKSQAFLTIEMEPAEVEQSVEKAYERLVQKANIPGFRKGKAPRPVLERHIGKDRLFESALDTLIPEAYDNAVKEQGIHPIAQPAIEVTQTEPLIFKATIPLRPTVKLGDYRKIVLANEAPVEVTEQQINTVIEEMRHREANWESIELRTADFGDLLVIDLEGKIGDKPFAEQKNVPYQLKKENPVPVPGFAEQLNGVKKGDYREFTLPIPADYPVAELVGKEALFKVKVRDVSQEILPAVDDEFAKRVDNKCNTVNELRESVVKEMTRSVVARASQKFEDKIIDMVAGISETEYPPVLVEAEVNRIINQRFPRGRDEMEAYLKRIGKTVEAFHAGLHPYAEIQVKNSLVLDKVAEEEKIEVTDQDVDAEIKSVVATIEQAGQENAFNIMNAPENRVTVRNTVRTRKTFQRLMDIANENAANSPAADEKAAPEKEKEDAPANEKKATRRKEKKEEDKKS